MQLSDQQKIFKAIEYASIKHENQRRKGIKKRPYINHPIQVANILSEIGGETHIDLLLAALLHDTIEDTDTTAEDLKNMFGEAVASVVLEVTDDMKLPSAERKAKQVEKADSLSDMAKKIKIADKSSNIQDLISYPILWTIQKKRNYIKWCSKVIDKCKGINPKLDSHFDEIMSKAIKIYN